MKRTLAGLRRASLPAVLSAAGLLAACGPGADPPEVDVTGLPPRLAERIQERRQAVTANPGSAEAWGALGMVLDVHDLRAGAAHCYERALGLDGDDFRWPYFLGVLKLTSNQGEALVHFSQAARIRDDYPPLWVYMGSGHLLGERFEEAAGAFQRALDLDGDFYRARIGLAKVALARDEARRARELLETALAQGASEGEVHWLLAQASRRLGDLEAASTHLRRARPLRLLEPVSDSLRVALRRQQGLTLALIQERTDHLIRRGRAAEAIEEWRQVQGEEPDSPEVLARLGRAQALSGRLDEAVSAYRAALGLDPAHLDAQVLLGDALLQQRQIGLARAAYEGALGLDPSHAKTRFKLGSILILTGAEEEGLRHLRQARGALSHDLEAQLLFAAAVTRLGRHREAAGAYREALDTFPGETSLQRGLAWLLATSPDSGVRDGAEALLRAREAAEGPADPRTLETLAAAHAEAGDFPEAVGAATRAKELLLKAGNRAAVRQVERRLKLYREGRPYREPGR